MHWFVIVILVFWFAFGSPSKDIANWFWGNNAAPWEAVDAFDYPDRHNLFHHEVAYNVGSVDACRSWVSNSAERHNDPHITKGDFECGVTGGYWIPDDDELPNAMQTITDRLKELIGIEEGFDTDG